MPFDPVFFTSVLWTAFAHLPMSLFLVIVPMIFGLAIGAVLALVRFHRVPFAAQLALVFIAVVRGTPVIVLIFIVYFLFLDGFGDLATALGLPFGVRDVPLYWVVAAALTLMVSAFAADALRSGLLAIDPGQFRAARSVGLNEAQALRRIVVPQLMPVVMPQLTNIFIGTFKATSLAYLVSVTDVMGAAVEAAGIGLRYIEAYAAVALVYWSASTLAAFGLGQVESRFRFFQLPGRSLRSTQHDQL